MRVPHSVAGGRNVTLEHHTHDVIRTRSCEALSSHLPLKMTSENSRPTKGTDALPVVCNPRPPKKEVLPDFDVATLAGNNN